MIKPNQTTVPTFLFFLLTILIISLFPITGCKNSQEKSRGTTGKNEITGIGFARKGKNNSEQLSTKRAYQTAIEQILPSNWKYDDKLVRFSKEQLLHQMIKTRETRSVKNEWLVHSITFTIETDIRKRKTVSTTGQGTSTNTPSIAYARAKSAAIKQYSNKTGEKNGTCYVNGTPQFSFSETTITCTLLLEIMTND